MKRMAQFVPLAATFVSAVAVVEAEFVEVEGQPLAANATRLVSALDYLGAPLSGELREGVGGGGQGA